MGNWFAKLFGAKECCCHHGEDCCQEKKAADSVQPEKVEVEGNATEKAE